jgi:hypothetical protein
MSSEKQTPETVGTSSKATARNAKFTDNIVGQSGAQVIQATLSCR